MSTAAKVWENFPVIHVQYLALTRYLPDPSPPLCALTSDLCALTVIPIFPAGPRPRQPDQ